MGSSIDSNKPRKDSVNLKISQWKLSIKSTKRKISKSASSAVWTHQFVLNVCSCVPTNRNSRTGEGQMNRPVGQIINSETDPIFGNLAFDIGLITNHQRRHTLFNN